VQLIYQISTHLPPHGHAATPGVLPCWGQAKSRTQPPAIEGWPCQPAALEMAEAKEFVGATSTSKIRQHCCWSGLLECWEGIGALSAVAGRGERQTVARVHLCPGMQTQRFQQGFSFHCCCGGGGGGGW